MKYSVRMLAVTLLLAAVASIVSSRLASPLTPPGQMAATSVKAGTPAPAGGASDQTPPFVQPAASPATTPVATLETNSIVTGTNAFATFDAWRARFAAADATTRAQLESEGVTLASARRTALRGLIVRDPRNAIEVALPSVSRAGLPLAVSALLEEQVSARGDLNVIFARPQPGQELSCSEPVIRTVQLPGRFFYAYTYGRRLRQMSTPASSLIGIAVDDRLALLDRPYRVLETVEVAALPSPATLLTAGPCPACGKTLPTGTADATFVDTGGSVMALHSASEAPAFFTAPDGTTIWAAGGSGGTGVTSPVVPETSSQGNKKFLFIRVRFADDDPAFEPETDATVRGDLNTTMRRFAELSYGSLQGTYAFTPTLTLPKPRSGYMNGWSDVDGMTALMNDAKALAASIATDPAFPGVPYPFLPANYSLFVARWNGEPGGCCSYGGGGNAWIRWDGASVLIHEWGHAVGQPHANWWNPTTDDPIGPGTHEEYGNKFDNMGSGGIEEDFGAMHKALVKWLPATNYWTVTSNGTYRVFAHDQPTLLSTNRYGVKVFRPSRDDTQYWLEHRAYTVTGANATYWTYGVAVMREWDWELLDMTPGSTKFKDDCPLTIGRTWSDAAAGIHYTPIARGTSPQPWVDVAVAFDDDARPNHPPVAIVTASSYTVATGTSISLTATAADPDGDTLAYAWDFGDGNISVNNLQTQTRSWSAAGNYVVQCVVSDRRGGTSRQNVAVRVGTPSDYSISGRVMAMDGSPIANARISDASGNLTFSRSDGSYALSRLSAGSYSLTAVHNGYKFAPASRAITVGPSAVGADFTTATVIGPGSGLTRQVWFNISGNPVANLTNNARFPNSPDLTEALADAFETPLDWNDTYGQRVSGWFVPPLSGGYRFYIASDDASQLFLSPTTNAASKARIAYMTDWTDNRNWTANASQKSALIQLAAGQPYYIEALHKEGSGGDNLAVGIDLPDGTEEKPIPYHRLIPLSRPPVAPSEVSLIASDPTATEGSDTGVFTLSRTGETAEALDVFFSMSGTAAYSADYAATGLKQTIPAGSSSIEVLVSPVNDAVAETAETVVMTLVAGTNYTLTPTAGSALVTINDNDGSPVVSIVASGPNASKTGPQLGRLTIQRAGLVTAAITVNYSITGTAANGVDYALITNKVMLDVGQAAADVVIAPTAAAGMEAPKTVLLNLTAGTGYTIASPASATVTIAQPGPGFGLLREWWTGIGNAGTVSALTNFASFPASPTGREYLSTSAEGPHDWEDNYGSRLRGWFIAPASGIYYFYIATDDGGELRLGTSALASSARRIAYVNGWVDYHNWTAQANQKSGAIVLTAGQRYYLEALHAEGGGGDHISVGVQFPGGALERPITAQWLEPWSDKGTLVAAFATAPTAGEAGAPGEFTLKRTGDPSASLPVTFAISGTASSGADYTALGTSATFTNGQSEMKLPVRALLDAATEGAETVTLTLQANAAYDLGFSNAATVTIIADPPRANVSATDSNAGEAGGNTGTFRIAFPSATYGPVTFNYALGGTAISGADFNTLPGSVTLAPGQSGTNLFIVPAADEFVEGLESVTLTLLPGSGYLGGAVTNATVTISDANTNHPPVLSTNADQVLFAGQMLTLTNTANDPDLPPQPLTFGVVGAPAGLVVDPVNGVLTWRPALAQSPLTTQIQVTVSDSMSPSLSATQSFWVTVNRPTTTLASPALTAEGFTLHLAGDPGPDLTIQHSTNLLDWVTLWTTNSPALPIEWTDNAATNATQGYYRVLLGP